MWTAATAYSASSNGGRGDYVRQRTTPALNSERVFRCTSAGTSLAAEPTWSITKNGVTAETAGPTWTECTGQEADQVAGNWKAPHARLVNAIASTWMAAGDALYVGANHAETQPSAWTGSPPGVTNNLSKILCVSATGSLPPVSADLRTTATVTTTGSSPITLGGGYYYLNGISFYCGTGAVSAGILLGNSSSIGVVLESVLLAKMGTNGAAAAINFGTSGTGGMTWIKLKNTALMLGSITDTVQIQQCRLVWQNTPNAIAGSVFPTTLFKSISPDLITFEGVDLSALGSGKTLVAACTAPAIFQFKDCKLGSAVNMAATQSSPGGAEIQVMRSDSSGTNYRNEKYRFEGTQLAETTIIRTGGANDGVTGLSWNLTSSVNSQWVLPFETFPIVIKNLVTGANVNVTVQGLLNAAALPNNDDVWFDVEYMGSAASPQGSFQSGTKSDLLATGTAWSASTQAWDSLVTARANSTAYTVGMVRKLASNPGRIFFCTTAGTSAASEPAGYTSAVDGGSVTDGTAVFRAAMRFQMTVALTSPQPAQVGYIYAYPKAAKASTAYYLCPKVTLS
ncbi:hypothetical protein [Glaciimonas sp. PCH181]|uniref:hypothetical protein n=1 Tax=Glaciimonas sp. PCH181 TaxID=2133943 RepID=UPI000D3763FE|nr:hypothetical protein [Glaciimonas sp. PCH181]PUA17277.1 hypothetical protein C7W93_15205 [Glaciimonas sp. PCH181]